MKKKNTLNRRSFIKSSIAASACLSTGPFIRTAKAQKPLRIAVIGIGGRCGAHYSWMNREQIVALCDCDEEVYRKNPLSKSSVKYYRDYRELFEKPDMFDTVVVCTPDHHHYPAAIRAIKAGKSVFVEKPLTWSPWESQQIGKATLEAEVATQMGNQGMGSMGWRIGHAYYASGVIGQVTEVHAWRPTQGGPYGRPDTPLPIRSDPVPDSLDWDVWLGPAAERKFKANTYHPKQWRQWTDYGGGTLGDWGCHILNAVFKLLEPGYPTKVEMTKCTPFNKVSYPAGRVIHWTFPETGVQQGFEMYWHEGSCAPDVPVPKDLEKERKMPSAGVYFVGTKGTLFVAGGHNNSAYIIPDSKRKAFGTPQLKVPKSRGHFQEFVQAAKGQLKWNDPLSNFIYASNLTGIMLLGNIALRTGKKLEMDPKTMQITNLPDSKGLLMQRIPGPGWFV